MKLKNIDTKDLLEDDKRRKIWRLVLTGGPCGGKTTGQARLATFFENIGWKVYRAPETASVLLAGGVNFADLTEKAAVQFQENLLRTMLQIEESFFALAEASDKDCLVICDRGSMDASAFVSRDQWDGILANTGCNEVDIRDNRYNQVVHMVSSANGAERFYTVDNHATRLEGLDEARMRDKMAAEAWVGHPYVDIIDNSTDFETKINRLIAAVTQKIGIDTGDRLRTNARKIKFVVNSPLPDNSAFPSYADFNVRHHYLRTGSRQVQSRLRKRGRQGRWSYIHTIRSQVSGQWIDVKTPLSHREYTHMRQQEDKDHYTVCKTRRCFVYDNQYFQLDIYKEPCHPRCKGIVLMETYTTLTTEELRKRLPDFLNVGDDVTGDPAFSMFNLSLKQEWINSQKFCKRLSDSEDGEEEQEEAVKEAHKKLQAVRRNTATVELVTQLADCAVESPITPTVNTKLTIAS